MLSLSMTVAIPMNFKEVFEEVSITSKPYSCKLPFIVVMPCLHVVIMNNMLVFSCVYTCTIYSRWVDKASLDAQSIWKARCYHNFSHHFSLSVLGLSGGSGRMKFGIPMDVHGYVEH